MAYFAALCTDKPDSLALRLATRPTHLEWIGAQGTAIRLAGPFLGEDEKPVGSLIVVEADDKASAVALLRADPYAKAGLFAAVDVRPWAWTIGKPA